MRKPPGDPPKTLSFPAGEVILYPGATSPQDPVFRVVEGLVRIQHVDEEGGALTLRFVRPGEFFGEEALAGLERRHFAEAMCDTRVEVIPPGEVDHRELTASLARGLALSYQAIRSLSEQRLKNRIAAVLLELSDSPLASRDSRGNPVIRLTHDDIAAAVGSVRETVTKVMGELAREGVVQTGYARVVILRPVTLAVLAGERGGGRKR